MAGRPTKYSQETTDAIVEHLSKGNTRKLACELAGISEATFANWLKKYSDFCDSIARAEAKPETQIIDLLFEAATGKPYEKRTRTTRTVIERRRITDPDGTVTDEPVLLELVTETVETGSTFDWRAGIEWLRRRHRGQWGDSADPDLDEHLTRLLESVYARLSPAAQKALAKPPGQSGGTQ